MLCCYGAVQAACMTGPADLTMFHLGILTGNITRRLQLTPGSPHQHSLSTHSVVRHIFQVSQGNSTCGGVAFTQQVQTNLQPITSKGPQGDVDARSAFLLTMSLSYRTHARRSMRVIPMSVLSRSIAQKHTYCLTQPFLFLLESLFALLTPRKLINY